MPFNRTSSCVAIGLLLCLLAAPTFGQGPLGFQIFAPADVSTYGGIQQPNEGYFFKFDGLWWSISAPEVRPIGFPGTRRVNYGPNDSTDVRIQTNTLDTSIFDNQFSAGNRIEFGRIENRNGWFVSIYQQRDQTQDYTAQAADMVFNDPAFGPHGESLLQGNVNNNSTTVPPFSPPVFRNLPVTFSNIFVENAIDTWGVELNYIHRYMTCHHGGTFELFLGTRYYEFNDNFRVHTASPTLPGNAIAVVSGNVPSFLGGSYWDTEAENHIVGPQVGLRWFKKQGRWTFSTEGRFMAGLNCQNLAQQVDMGPNLRPGVNANGTYTPFQPTVMSHTTSTHIVYAREFSPLLELRLEGKYQITRAIEFNAGWTGWWVDGIARASSVVDYTVPSMGIDLSGNREGVFVNGLTIGFTVNR
jgi:hypothetical protein